jgi:hypothetical protein
MYLVCSPNFISKNTNLVPDPLSYVVWFLLPTLVVVVPIVRHPCTRLALINLAATRLWRRQINLGMAERWIAHATA